MRTPSAAMTAAWKSQAKTGNQKPMVRATIQKANIRLWAYDTAMAPGGDFGIERHRRGQLASIIFGDPSPAREIPNILNYSWTRGTDQDVATCTMTILNAEIVPLGVDGALNTEDFELPGFLTYNRGETKIGTDRWGYDQADAGRPNRDNGWQDMFVPDRMVRTYEGYGFDASVPPALDANLMQSGTWLIDKVTYSDDGTIKLDMRDVGRLLLDQIVFPPVVPYHEYPLEWEPIHTTQVPGRDCKGGSWVIPGGTASSSNDKYIGKGLTDPPYANYVSSSGGVQGHHAKDALNARDFTYWLSTGQTTPSSKVWWQVDLDNPQALAGVRINPRGGPYRIYISVKGPNGWIGKKKIPYEVTTEGVDVDAHIPFVTSVYADRRSPFEVILPRKYRNVHAVRLTFTRLMDTQVGNYPFRASLDLVHLYLGSYDSLSFGKGTFEKVVGNYRDYTQIVKWACAWGGFFWPPHNADPLYNGDSHWDYQQLSYTSDPTAGAGKRYISYDTWDPVLPLGRAWGSFMPTGTASLNKAKLSIELFDKKPLMDMINYVRDVTGFIFYIDETGGAVWRLPNLGINVTEPKQGNYLSPGQLDPRSRTRTSDTVILDEEETLLSYETTLDSANLRERIFVANTTGKVGTVIKGFVPTFTGHGFRRMAGWTDQHFESKGDARVMADFVAAQSMFTYRKGKARIPGYPAIQVDDQVRIFERITNETYFHYVSGITSTLDMEQGTWFYDLDTHWLGERPSDAWVVNPTQLDTVTQAYLNEIS